MLQSQPVLEQLAELKASRGWRMGLSVSGMAAHSVVRVASANHLVLKPAHASETMEQQPQVIGTISEDSGRRRAPAVRQIPALLVWTL